MPWISSAEYARMESALDVALQRATDAEQRLSDERKRLDDIVAAERQSKDWVMVQMASRVVTRHGGYGLEHEIPTSQSDVKSPHPKGFIRDPDEMDAARLDYYKKCYLEAGKSEEDAAKLWETEMRGETPAYEYENES